jgi:RNA polymerase sigma-70 factor (ECF subfamily)
MTTGPAENEGRRILELKRGRMDAAGTLMDHYGESLMRYLHSILGNREAAEDVFQEVWIKVMRKIGRFHDGEAFGPWLFRVARNTAYDTLRGRKRWWSLDTGSGKEGEEVPEVADPSDFGRRVLARETVSRAMGELTPGFREVLELRFIEELSYDEIAAVCRRPLGTVKSRLKRGLERLAERLGEARNDVP